MHVLVYRSLKINFYVFYSGLVKVTILVLQILSSYFISMQSSGMQKHSLFV